MVWVGCATAAALAFQTVSKHTYEVIHLELLLSRNSRNVLRVFSERVVTESDTDTDTLMLSVYQMAAGTVNRPPAMGSVSFRHQICSSKLMLALTSRP